MEKITSIKTYRGHALIKILGLMALVLLMLVSIAGASPFAYITNTFDNNVSVIDTATNNVTAIVPVGPNPYGVAVSSDGTKVYVTNLGVKYTYDGTVSVIDTTTNTVTATVPVGNYPKGVAVNPDGTKVYVANSGGNNVSVIDTVTNNVIAAVNVGNGPEGIVVNPDGTKVYVTNWNTHNVSVIDAASNTVVANIPVDVPASGVAVSPDGTKVFVTTTQHLLVIDTTSDTVINKLSIDDPGAVVVSPDGTKVYTTETYYGNVLVIDTATNSVTATITNLGDHYRLAGISVTPDGSSVYVAMSEGDIVYVIDTESNTIRATVPVGDAPVAWGLFIGGNVVPVEGTNLYLSSQAPESKEHGSSMTYRLYYGNNGNISANNVVIEDKLPNDVKFESASDSGVYDSSTKMVRWNIGSVNSTGHGYRTLNVSIPKDVLVGTVIVNNASISTSDPEIQYNDNEAQGKTTVTGLILPPEVGVEPNNGGIGIPSVFMGNPITFSYHNTGLPVTGVNITIHSYDGLPDITGTMTNPTNSMSDWTYTTTFAPRHGLATVTCTKHLDPLPYKPNYDIRGYYGDKVTADEIYNFIKFFYPQSPMLSEPDIGSRFINSAKAKDL